MASADLDCVHPGEGWTKKLVYCANGGETIVIAFAKGPIWLHLSADELRSPARKDFSSNEEFEREFMRHVGWVEQLAAAAAAPAGSFVGATVKVDRGCFTITVEQSGEFVLYANLIVGFDRAESALIAEELTAQVARWRSGERPTA